MTDRLLPGLHPDVPAAVYHADPCETPSLSASIAKILIEKTPRHAWFAHPRLNPDFKPNEDEKFDLGRIVHELALRKGSGIDVFEFTDWRTKAAQAGRNESRAAGHTPVLREQFDKAVTIAASAARRLPQNPCDEIHRELVAVWKHGGVICRGMMDCVGEAGIYDIKTQADISDEGIARVIPRFGYDLQAAAYLDGLTTLRPEIAGRIGFCWVFVETGPPFDCRVIEADPTTLAIGAKKWQRALDIWTTYIGCKLASWPGYPPEPTTITYPEWAESAWLERELEEIT